MYKILVADDEPIERLIVAKKIQKYFGEELVPVFAENGIQVLEQYHKEQCSILLLDIEMPEIDGLYVAQQVRQLDPHCIIIFVTAYDHFSYAKKAIGVRAFDYLLKPLEDTEFISVLQEAIRVMREREDALCPPNKVPGEEALEIKPVIQEEDTQVRLGVIKQKIEMFIEAGYQEDLSLQDVAKMMRYSDTYLCKVFKECFHKSFITYLSELRMTKAKALLRDVTIPINEISLNVGYRDANYFARVFKRLEGVTPSEYRMQHLKVAWEEC